jgi:hypothetical protein
MTYQVFSNADRGEYQAEEQSSLKELVKTNFMIWSVPVINTRTR